MKHLILTFICFFFIIDLQINAQFQLSIEGDAQVLGRLDIQSAGTNNTFVGHQSGISHTSGSENAFLGTRAGYLNQNGGANSYFGYEAGRNNLSGSENCAFGRFALANNQLKKKNIAIGSRALLQLEDGYGVDPIGGTNDDIGTLYNLAIGTNAGHFTNDPTGSDAERNTFVGHNSGALNSTGWRNAFFGFQAGDNNNTGYRNTCIGHEADVSLNNLNNATAVGHMAVVNASNKVRIGNTDVAVIEGQVAWSFPSDSRFKTHVKEDVPGLAFLLPLRPVTYHFDVGKFNDQIRSDQNQGNIDPKQQRLDKMARETPAIVQTGFIAQEVEATARAIGFDFNGVIKPQNEKDNYGISYSLFVPPIIKGIQEQQMAIDQLQKKVNASQETIHSQSIQIDQLEKTVDELKSLVEKLMTTK